MKVEFTHEDKGLQVREVGGKEQKVYIAEITATLEDGSKIISIVDVPYVEDVPAALVKERRQREFDANWDAICSELRRVFVGRGGK